ncbi:MAG: alpha-amylase family glycosyl hydrolase, partial [Terriglobales bacterium]
MPASEFRPQPDPREGDPRRAAAPLLLPALSCTYRLQLQPAFGCAAAAAQCDYLAALGVSHAFCSPLLAAAPGSTHGYDVTDPERVNPELGGESGFADFVAALRARHLGLVLDIVPNHMCIATPQNRWWWSVLEKGERSEFARIFDITWRPPAAAGPPRRLVLPVLAQPLAQAVAAGDVRLERRDGRWIVACGQQQFPLAPTTTPTDDAEAAQPAALLALLARQPYRLSHWSLADRNLSYRRFFDISSLAGLRVEDPAVLAATHRRIFAWRADTTLAGVRIDHLDGLREPRPYLERLRAQAPTAWIVAEKILARGESLRPDWPLDGTTGYDFLNTVQRLFLAPAGAAALDRTYAAFAGPRPGFPDLAAQEKSRVLTTMFGGDLRRLTDILLALRPLDPGLAPYQRETLSAALRLWAASLPVYRTYIESHGPASPADRAVLDAAYARVAAADPNHAPSLHATLHALLVGQVADP